MQNDPAEAVDLVFLHNDVKLTKLGSFINYIWTTLA